jgi:hypothetical protein
MNNIHCDTGVAQNSDFSPTRSRLRLFFAYDGGMGEMKRREAREADQRDGSRYVSTLVIAAAIIAAVRLARDDIGRPSPRIVATISESVSLARSLLDNVLRRYPGERARGT